MFKKCLSKFQEMFYKWKKLHLLFQACPHRPLKHISHFMSILSMLFSCSSIAILFYRLNKLVMMCLRVNVQCANCFDLSRNKSDWHFIFIFVAHNRPPPSLTHVPLCRHARGIIFKSKARTVPARTENYFDLSRVL